MANEIHNYDIERLVFGDDDYYDIDWFDGSIYRTAKIKGSVIKAGINAGATNTNVYNSDGTLTQDRTITGANFEILFQTLGQFIVESHKNGVDGNVIFEVRTDATNHSFIIRDHNTGVHVLACRNGKVEISDSYFLPNTDGTAGQVLTTDGSGNVTWTSPNSEELVELPAVINVLNNPPASTDGDRYRIGTSPTGAWAGKQNQIAQWDAGTTAWIYTIPVADNIVYQTTTATTFRFNGTAWNQWTGTPILQNGNKLGVGVDMTIGTIDGGSSVWVKVQDRPAFWHSLVAFAQRAGGIGAGTYYGTFNLSALTTNRIFNLPNKAGTFAMLDDIPPTPATDFIPKISGFNVSRFMTFMNNSTTVFYSGLFSGALSGTQTPLALAGATATKIIRTRFTSGTTSGSIAGYRGSGTDFSVGMGFHAVFTFGFADTSFNSSAHNWVGLGASATFQIGSLTYASSLTNTIGVGNDPSDTTLQIIHNDSGVGSTKIALGSDFPANRTAGTAFNGMFCLELFNEIGSSQVKWRMTRIDTGTVEQGTITTNLPNTTTFLCPVVSRSNGSSSSIASVMDVSSIQVFTKY